MTARTHPFVSVVSVSTPRPTDEILAVIAAKEPHGATADQVARTIGLGLDGEAAQADLEELVTYGDLDRRGIGAGAVYTLGTTARLPG